MEKVEQFFNRHKGHFLWGFSVVFILFFLLCHFKSDIYNVKDDAAYFHRYTDSTQAHADPGIFPAGCTVNQTFTAVPDTYQSLDINFASLAKENAGTLDIQLVGSSIDEHWVLNCNTISENEYTRLSFENPITLEENTQLSIIIRFDTPSDELTPSIFMYPNLDSESESQHTIGRTLQINSEPVNETLVFRMTISDNRFAIAPFLGITAFVVLGFIALYLLRNKLKIEAFALVTMLGLGLVYNFVYTPMSVPDEVCHSLSAYHYSNLMTFHFDDSADCVYMRSDDADLFNQSSNVLSKYEYAREQKSFDLFAKDTELVPVSDASYITTKDLAYAAPALGITLGRIFHLGSYPTYYLGRTFNLIFLALCMYFAMKRMPYGKIALAAVGMLPMTLHLAASYSYDCYTIGLCMLLFAQLLALYNQERVYTAKDMILTSLLALLAIPYKVAYIGIAFIALMLPSKNFKSKKQHILWKLLLVSSGILGIVVMELPRIIGILSSAASATAVDTAAAANDYYSAAFIVQHPLASAMLFLRTLRYLGDWYYTTMIGLYTGWFQIAAPSVFLVPFSVILLLAFSKKENEPNSIGTMKKWYLTLLSVFMMFLVMLALMFSWTPLTSTVIYGVQGRYFLPILPLVFLILRNNTLVLKKNFDHALVLSSLFFNIMVLTNVFSQVFAL